MSQERETIDVKTRICLIVHSIYSRLGLQINDLTCACKELKKKQGMSDVEVERLKDSIKDYVFKIKEVEDTLALKVCNMGLK